MIVQLLGGIFDGGYLEVRGDESAIAVNIGGTDKYAIYIPNRHRKDRYNFHITKRKSEIIPIVGKGRIMPRKLIEPKRGES